LISIAVGSKQTIRLSLRKFFVRIGILFILGKIARFLLNDYLVEVVAVFSVNFTLLGLDGRLFV